MSVKHIKDYYDSITADYINMKNTLEEMQRCVNEESSAAAMANIDNIKNMVSKMKENYMRISYIMYLLNMPKKRKEEKIWKTV